MSTAPYTCIQAKPEEELIMENEPSVNYARNLGKIGQALAEHFKHYQDCFHRTGTPFCEDGEKE